MDDENANEAKVVASISNQTLSRAGSTSMQRWKLLFAATVTCQMMKHCRYAVGRQSPFFEEHTRIPFE